MIAVDGSAGIDGMSEAVAWDIDVRTKWNDLWINGYIAVRDPGSKGRACARPLIRIASRITRQPRKERGLQDP